MNENEVLCEISTDQVVIGLNAPKAGVLAKILVQASGDSDNVDEVDTDKVIGIIVNTKEDYMTHIDELRQEAQDEDMMKSMEELKKLKEPSANRGLALMKEIKHLIQRGDLNEDDQVLIQELQSLAIQEDKQIMTVFDASFDDDLMSFDSKFFLDNVRNIIKTKEENMKEDKQ